MEKDYLCKLSAISSAWKAQFLEPHGEYWMRKQGGALPDLPLEWTIADGLLFLDGVWICPVDQVNVEKLGEDISVTPVTLELDLHDSFLTIIIVNEFGKYEIAGVERTLFSQKRKKP